jgi:hypothetical protein
VKDGSPQILKSVHCSIAPRPLVPLACLDVVLGNAVAAVVHLPEVVHRMAVSRGSGLFVPQVKALVELFKSISALGKWPKNRLSDD